MKTKVNALLAATMLALCGQAHAKTLTIAVIDTGIDARLPNLCRMGHKSFVKRLPNPLSDEHGHGSHVAGLISANAGIGNYCLVAIKYYDPTAAGSVNEANLIKAIRYAINIKVDYINLSGGGPEADEHERSLIERALKRKIKVVVAAGNGDAREIGEDLDKKCNYFPACYDKRLVVVGNLQVGEGTAEISRCPSSNYGKYVNRWEIGTNVESTVPDFMTGKITMQKMTGTSQATAIATGKLVKEALAPKH